MPLATYSPKRTYLVNTGGTKEINYLIRGNEPLSEDNSFAYNAINKKLKTLIKDFNLTKFKLITISLIDNNPQSERPDLEREFKAYGITNNDFDAMFPWQGSWPPVYRKIDVEKQYGTTVNGYSGSVVWYPVQGCTDMSNCAIVEPAQFNFSGLIDYINSIMTTQQNTVIYYHCEHGHDRTGAVSAAYMLKYMGRTIDEVLTERPPLGAKAFTHPWASTYEQLIKYYYSTLQ